MILERWLPGLIRVTKQGIGQRQYSNIVSQLSKPLCEKIGETVKIISLGMKKTSHSKEVFSQGAGTKKQSPQRKGHVHNPQGCYLAAGTASCRCSFANVGYPVHYLMSKVNGEPTPGAKDSRRNGV
jgi:hypothetical protein